MTKISTEYSGDLRCTAIHLKSSSELITDAPTDNHGKGESFSPTDLLATSLISCMLTVMDIKAKSMDLDLSGSYGEVEKIMRSNPRAVHQLIVKLNIKGVEKAKDRALLERVGVSCPVALSLHPDLIQDYGFVYLEN